MRGHTLCWHNQTPRWLFRDTVAHINVTKEVLLKRLKDHITTVVNRYKGKVYAWDVVNEVIADDSATYFRNTLWYQICGEDFVAKAFEFAHEADPKAILFYNVEIPDHVDPPFRFMLTHHSGDVDPPRYL